MRGEFLFHFQVDYPVVPRVCQAPCPANPKEIPVPQSRGKHRESAPGGAAPLPGREEGGAAKAAFPITQRVREQIGLVPFPVILEMLLPADDGDDGVAELGAQGQLVGMGSVGTERDTLEGGATAAFPLHPGHPLPRSIGFVWTGLGRGVLGSVRSCWKLPPCPAEPIPGGSKMDPLLAEAGATRNGGGTSGITDLRGKTQKSDGAAELSAQKSGVSTLDRNSSAGQGRRGARDALGTRAEIALRFLG